MKTWIVKAKVYGLAATSVVSLIVGAVVLESCAGSGGPVTNTGGNGSGGNNGGIAAQFKALEPAGQAGATNVGAAACGKCHNGQGGYTPIYAQWQGTEHYAHGVSCENCHGPGSKHIAAPAATNIIGFPNNNSYIVCAQCHGQIASDYSQSPHAQLVSDPVNLTASSPALGGQVYRCIVCHSGLMRAEYTERGTNPATMSLTALTTVANQTLSNVPQTANCATCHNPHKKTGNTSLAGLDVQLWHPEANTNITAAGLNSKAASFTNMNQACAECHNGWGSNPTDANLQASTSRPAFHEAPNYNMLMGYGGVDNGDFTVGSTTHSTMAGQCSKCHLPTSRHTFTVSYDISCTPCHTATDAANRAATIQAQTQAGMYQLLSRMEAWSMATFKDPDLWDYTANIQAEGKTPPNESSVPIQIMRARYNYYFISNDKSMGPHNAAYTNLLLTVANNNLNAINVPPAASTKGVSNQTIMAALNRQASVEKAGSGLPGVAR